LRGDSFGESFAEAVRPWVPIGGVTRLVQV
jgi:hypothetical protein